jgi:hypothetical protein
MGSGNPSFELKQEADGKITGTYSGQLCETDLARMIKAEGNKISGKVVLGTMDSGTFTGVKN